MKKNFDILVIGATNAGYSSALKLSKEGKSVAVIDNHEYGGCGLKKYCNLKKYLTKTAFMNYSINHLYGSGLDGVCKINWHQLIENKNSFLEKKEQELEKSLKESRIEVISGYCCFKDKNSVFVEDEEYSASKIIIATGTTSKYIDNTNLFHIKTSEDFLEMEWLPKSIIFIGGGIMAFELAFIAKQAGSKVTIVHHNNKVLKQFDCDLVHDLIKHAKKEGIDIIKDFEISKIKSSSNGYRIIAEDNRRLEAQMIFNVIGKVPNIEELKLENAGVSYNNNGIVVDKFMKTSNESCYAVGDVVDTLRLASVTDMEIDVAIENILKENTKTIDYAFTPITIFSFPPLSCVGQSEDSLILKNIKYEKKYISNKDLTIKILTSDDDKILSVYILGDNSNEIINIFAMAMKFEIKLKELNSLNCVYGSSIAEISRLLK